MSGVLEVSNALSNREKTTGAASAIPGPTGGSGPAVLENELLRVVVLIDKGADVYEFLHKPTDTDFVWRSPWGVRDPSKFVPTTGSHAELWLDQYEGGWQTVLPGGGFPVPVRGHSPGPPRRGQTPCRGDACIVEDTPERVALKCWVRTARTPFYFEKTMTLESGSAVLKTDELLVNEGEETTHAVWGEHIAIGEPFLNEGLRDRPARRHHPSSTPTSSTRTAS